MPKITVTIDSVPRELEARHLTEAASEYWSAWVAYQARLSWNPLLEIYEKAQVLPRDQQQDAIVAMIAGTNITNPPAIFLLNRMQKRDSVALLASMILGLDGIVTDDNASELFALLRPYIEPEVLTVVDSLEEANRLRAEVGKPPIGG